MVVIDWMQRSSSQLRLTKGGSERTYARESCLSECDELDEANDDVDPSDDVELMLSLRDVTCANRPENSSRRSSRGDGGTGGGAPSL